MNFPETRLGRTDVSYWSQNLITILLSVEQGYDWAHYSKVYNYTILPMEFSLRAPVSSKVFRLFPFRLQFPDSLMTSKQLSIELETSLNSPNNPSYSRGGSRISGTGVQHLKKGTHGGSAAHASEHQRRDVPLRTEARSLPRKIFKFKCWYAFSWHLGIRVHVFPGCKKSRGFQGKILVLCNERGPYLIILIWLD
jgi:hypothetical protein